MRVNIENDGLEVDLGAESFAPSPDGLGLFSIRERLQYLGGSLEVESDAGSWHPDDHVVPLKISCKAWRPSPATPSGQAGHPKASTALPSPPV